MYTPASLATTDPQALAFIDEYNFGLLVSASLAGTHLPLIRKTDEHGVTRLYGHFAKANSHWKTLEDSPVLAVFTGPHTYVSPTRYAQAPAVPTWNYTAVHCQCTAKLLDDDATLTVLTEMLEYFEPELLANKTVISDEHRDKLRKAIVGFELTVNELQGKFKLGQNRSKDDQTSLFAHLKQSSRDDDRQVAAFMDKYQLGQGF